MIQIFVPLALLTNGIATGVMLATSIGPVPFSMILSYERYVQYIKFMWARYDPLMPILNGTTFVLDVVLTLMVIGAPAAPLFGLAAALLAAVIAVSLTKNAPINRYVISLDPEAPPGDWAARDPRIYWRNWNVVRTVLVLLALGANLVALATLL
jgi:uncharacterized membrane protein